MARPEEIAYGNRRKKRYKKMTPIEGSEGYVPPGRGLEQLQPARTRKISGPGMGSPSGSSFNPFPGSGHQLPYRPGRTDYGKRLQALVTQLRTGGKHGLSTEELQAVRTRDTPRFPNLPMPEYAPDVGSRRKRYVNRMYR